MNNYIHKQSNRGFTIIELFIVIVIIGILVAITAVSYNGITKNAKDASLKSELKQISTSLELNKAKTGIYPTSLSANNPPISDSSSANITYTQLDSGNSHSLTATDNSNSDISLSQTPATSAQPASKPIQTITKANCPTTRTMVRDQRDNSTYWIQKLADNQCWMLTNLAYAGGGNNTYNDVINQGTGAPGTPKGTLSNGTADTARTYTEAKYYISPSANPTTDPTPPSTATDGGVNTSTRQFGYLYNWCAAMGGQNTAACANATTPTPIASTNICPAGWRLPTGQAASGEFTLLNNAINGSSTTSSTGLMQDGLFQRSGYWGDVFANQGSYGRYWSSSQSTGANSHYLIFSSGSVDPVSSHYKSFGWAVRCIAN